MLPCPAWLSSVRVIYQRKVSFALVPSVSRYSKVRLPLYPEGSAEEGVLQMPPATAIQSLPQKSPHHHHPPQLPANYFTVSLACQLSTFHFPYQSTTLFSCFLVTSSTAPTRVHPTPRKHPPPSSKIRSLRHKHCISRTCAAGSIDALTA